MERMNTNLTYEQKDYAVFLPAISGFFAAFIGRQRNNSNYIPATRLPPSLTHGVESLNYLIQLKDNLNINGHYIQQVMLI